MIHGKRWLSSCIGLGAALVLACPAIQGQDHPFRRGDANLDRAFDVSDPIAVLGFLFLKDPAGLACLDAADANDDGGLDVSDPVAMLWYQFAGGPPPPPPYVACALDPTPDGLSCSSFPACGGPAIGGFLAQVVSVTVMPLEQAEVASIDGLTQQQLAFLGIEFDPVNREIRSPPLPLSGKWFEIDGRRVMSDRDGYLRLEKLPAQPASVPVYWQLGDADPVLVLERLEFVPAGQQPAATAARLSYRVPPHMDKGVGGGGIGLGNGESCALVPIPPGCPGTNATPCCEDYLGPHSDGKRYERTLPCYPIILRNFYGSQCYLWTFLKRNKPCYNEGALPWNPGGPGCWLNHKYRNCQNMDENDFSLFPEKREMKFGERLKFKVRNNTAANSTCLRIEPAGGEGEFALAPGAPPAGLVRDGRCGGWRLDHWNDGQIKHYEEVTLEYVAPQRDGDGKCVARYKIIAEADGLPEEFEVRVLPKRNAWQGTARGSQITTTEISSFESIFTAEVFFDLDAGDVSGTLTVKQTGSDPVCRHSGEGSTAITPNALTSFEIDFSTDPPTYRGTGATNITVDLTSVCGGNTFTNPLPIPNATWLDTFGKLFNASDDGCVCKDRIDLGIAAGTHIFFEWDLRKLPDS